jgi:hypothetical protein
MVSAQQIAQFLGHLNVAAFETRPKGLAQREHETNPIRDADPLGYRLAPNVRVGAVPEKPPPSREPKHIIGAADADEVTEHGLTHLYLAARDVEPPQAAVEHDMVAVDPSWAIDPVQTARLAKSEK